MRTIALEQPLVDIQTERAALEVRLQRLEDLERTAGAGEVAAERSRLQAELQRLAEAYDSLRRDIFASLTPLDKVLLARHPERPYMLDYLSLLVTDFTELRGDRRHSDDKAIVAGVALLGGQRPVGLAGHQKGRNVAERKARNFGQPGPSGYRKAVRVMQLAARFGHAVLTFIDTPGAACTPEAEELGISEALATAQLELARLPVPIIATVIGEGGSGGAIALGVADRVFMLEHSYYSVIAPESCASIIWRDGSRAPEAAEALRLSAQDAHAFGFCDRIINEPLGGAHHDPAAVARELDAAIGEALAELDGLTPEERIDARYAKFKAMGQYAER